jgi:hypothetical protein
MSDALSGRNFLKNQGDVTAPDLHYCTVALMTLHPFYKKRQKRPPATQT